MFRRFFRSSKGFTLLEIMIAITLTSIIVTMLSVALRTGVRTYTKGKETNSKLLKIASLENLLGKQLRAASGFELNEFLFFKGDSTSLSFVTPFSPFGSGRQGMFKVCYVYDEASQLVIYMQRLVTNQSDINEECANVFEKSEGITKNNWEYAALKGAKSLRFYYLAAPASENDVIEKGSWSEIWEKEREMPHLLRLEWEYYGEDEDKENSHVISSNRIFINNPFIFFDIL